MDRRQFLKLSAILGGVGFVAGTTGYWAMFGNEGMNDLGRFITSHYRKRKEVPLDKGLVDSHAHFSKHNNLQDLVNLVFDMDVFMQTISNRKQGVNYLTFEGFREGLSSLEGIEVVFQDKYAVVLRKEDQQVVFTQSEEFETEFDGSKKGLLRDHHEMHIVVEGFDDIKGEKSYDILKAAEMQGCPTTLAHPFTIPVRYIGFLPANDSEEQNLEQACEDFDVFIEGGNSANSLYMVGTNGESRDFAERVDRPLIYSTDSHAREDLRLVRKQVGRLGTLIPRFDVSEMDGREMIRKKYELIKQEGEMYGLPMNTPTFFRIMVATHLGI
ncbi:MAG: twin-arginine translocation signal domain-containing protein [archaeon]